MYTKACTDTAEPLLIGCCWHASCTATAKGEIVYQSCSLYLPLSLSASLSFCVSLDLQSVVVEHLICVVFCLAQLSSLQLPTQVHFVCLFSKCIWREPFPVASFHFPVSRSRSHSCHFSESLSLSVCMCVCVDFPKRFQSTHRAHNARKKGATKRRKQ